MDKTIKHSSFFTLCIILSAFLLITPLAFAVKTIRIEPHAIDPPNPIMLDSPATFTVNLTSHAGYDPQIFLVMSKDCYDGLTKVTVTWPGDGSDDIIEFSKGEFLSATSGFIPTGMSKADYQVSSLKDHLGVPHSEDIYWVVGPFLDDPITKTEQEFTVEITTSNEPRMLVYAIGKTKETGDYDNSVPNSRPGFVIPELPLGTISSLITMIAAIGYTYKKRN